MPSCTDILISIYPTHTSNIIDGTKRVELRRRAIRVPRGTKVWIYSTRPRASIDAFAIIDDVHELKPSELWKQFGKDAGISRQEFDVYFAGSKTGCAVVLRNVTALRPHIPLKSIRTWAESFQPPQFFKKLGPDSIELAFLHSAARSYVAPAGLGCA